MALKSMTGFGRSEVTTDQHYIVCEVKSVNHRFKDYRFRMPSYLNPFEMKFRKTLDTFFCRGSIDISVQVKKNPNLDEKFNFDYKKINQFLTNFRKEVSGYNISDLRPTDFLRNDFYTDQDESEKSEVGEQVVKALGGAIEENINFREIEGKKLESVFHDQIALYSEFLAEVEALRETLQSEVKEKLLKKFEENKQSIDGDDIRFQKEVIFYLEKLDVDEEISRAKIHLSKLKKVLSAADKTEQGRELEFLIQELNRETNTIGSKSNHEKISDKIIKMKVCMEKMREQALNIE